MASRLSTAGNIPRISVSALAGIDDPWWLLKFTLLLHGDADELVPLQQSQILIKKLQSANVPNRLIIKKDAAHGWVSTDNELKIVSDWFLLHLCEMPDRDPPQ